MSQLKYISAHLIRFKRIDDLDYLKREIFPLFAKVLDEEDDCHIAVEEDEGKEDVIVFFLEPHKISEIVRICKTKDVIIEERDITEELLSGTQEHIVGEMKQSDEYKELFEQFFRRNLTTDMILDKMNRIDSYELTELEKEILADG